jgi:phytoene dehydrogenase-like protein
MSSYDTIIIGAGLSGLAAGIRLAHYDRRVCILERHTTIGGLNSFYRLGGRNYDVGLHAVTNYTAKGARKGPLARLLRQLRFRWEDFALVPQIGSQIAFPGITLNFTNDFELFRSEVHRAFPAERANFDRLSSAIMDYDDLDGALASQSARSIVSEWIRDPLLIDMLFCPLQYYGGAREHDMDFGQFSVMFRSVFQEGFARPWSGIRQILKNLVRRFKELGGELRLRSGVQRMEVDEDRVSRVVLDDGSEITADRVLSSAGLVETLAMVDQRPSRVPLAGQLSFVEGIAVLDEQPQKLGCDRTIVFFNDSNAFRWQKPDDLVDVTSGVLCLPSNFKFDRPLDDAMVRVTALANYARWRSLTPLDYQAAKLATYERIMQVVGRFIPQYRTHTVASDIFTPTTVERFTGHANGAIYGSPEKRKHGTTHLKNLFLCGTDQGFVGIIGAMFSGIMIANRHVLGTISPDSVSTGVQQVAATVADF